MAPVNLDLRIRRLPIPQEELIAAHRDRQPRAARRDGDGQSILRGDFLLLEQAPRCQFTNAHLTVPIREDCRRPVGRQSLQDLGSARIRHRPLEVRDVLPVRRVPHLQRRAFVRILRDEPLAVGGHPHFVGFGLHMELHAARRNVPISDPAPPRGRNDCFAVGQESQVARLGAESQAPQLHAGMPGQVHLRRRQRAGRGNRLLRGASGRRMKGIFFRRLRRRGGLCRRPGLITTGGFVGRLRESQTRRGQGDCADRRAGEHHEGTAWADRSAAARRGGRQSVPPTSNGD